MKWGYLFAVLSMLSNVVCQQILSACLRDTGRLFAEAGWWATGKAALADLRFWAGGGFAAICLVLWALTLTQLPISRALPIMALLFIFSPLASAWLLDDSISAINMIGFGLVTVGVVLCGMR